MKTYKVELSAREARRVDLEIDKLITETLKPKPKKFPEPKKKAKSANRVLSII